MVKRVSFKVAKAIKEAGYPDTFITDENENQVYILFSDEPDNYLTYQSASIQGYLNEGYLTRLNIEWYFAPTYLDVWLWLWRFRGFYIDIAHYYDSDEVTIWDNNYNKIKSIECMGKYRDPEEVIEKAIDYLAENNLIK